MYNKKLTETGKKHLMQYNATANTHVWQMTSFKNNVWIKPGFDTRAKIDIIKNTRDLVKMYQIVVIIAKEQLSYDQHQTEYIWLIYINHM